MCICYMYNECVRILFIVTYFKFFSCFFYLFIVVIVPFLFLCFKSKANNTKDKPPEISLASKYFASIKYFALWLLI